MPLKLGKKPHKPDTRDLRLSRYMKVSTQPVAPDRFGFDHFIDRTGWGMLGNDEYGDCVWAGAAHEHMVYTGGNHRLSNMALFTTDGVLSDYSAETGFNPADPESDQGTNVREAMGYRRDTGIIDAAGKRHTIGAYVALDAGDWEQLVQAIYTFEAVGIGIEFPDTAYDQFNEGVPWDISSNAHIEGGHYIPGVGRTSANEINVVTWATLIRMTRRFYETYADEGWAWIAPDQLTGTGRSLRGFDVETLQADLAALAA